MPFSFRQENMIRYALHDWKNYQTGIHGLKGEDLDRLGQLMDIQEKVEANDARLLVGALLKLMLNWTSLGQRTIEHYVNQFRMVLAKYL